MLLKPKHLNITSAANKQEEAMFLSVEINATVLHAIATLYSSQTL